MIWFWYVGVFLWTERQPLVYSGEAKRQGELDAWKTDFANLSWYLLWTQGHSWKRLCTQVICLHIHTDKTRKWHSVARIPLSIPYLSLPVATRDTPLVPYWIHINNQKIWWLIYQDADWSLQFGCISPFVSDCARFRSVSPPMPDTWSQAMSIAKWAILGPTPGRRTSPSTLSGMSPPNSFCSIADVSFRYFTLV